MTSSEVLIGLRNRLIVSCQAEGNSPFNTPEGVAMFAIAAKMGGARGIRSEGIDKIRCIQSVVDLPIIGMIKHSFPNGDVRITRSFKEVEALLQLKVDIIAIDGTFRLVDGLTGPEFINRCKEKYSELCILADIAQINEAFECVKNGADCISTTLRGYTPETKNESRMYPNIEFIKQLCASFNNVPIIAEGKINTPDLAREISKLGVWSLVIGTAITRPHIITEWFVESINAV